MVDNKETKISGLGYSFVIFTGFLAIFLGEGTYMMFSIGKNDTVVTAIIGFILSFILFYIVRYIVNKNEQEDIYELNKAIFGNVFGRVFNIMLWIGFFIISLILIYSLSDYFNTEYLPETSINYLKILVILPIIYVTSKNLNTIIKTNQILSVFSIILIISTFIGVTSSFEAKNIEPLFIISKGDAIKNILTYVVLSIIPLSMFFLTSKKNISDSDKLNKNMLIMFILSNIAVIAIMFGTILTLGVEYLNIFRFPEYVALKQFSLFDILERVENLLALQYFFNNFGILSLLYYYMIKLIPKTRLKQYYSIVISAVQYILTMVLFKNTSTFIAMVQQYFVILVAVFILFPILITFLKLLKKGK